MIAMIETSSVRVFNDCDDRDFECHECSMIVMIEKPSARVFNDRDDRASSARVFND